MIIIHYSEIGLKGGNRDYFENRLVQNIKQSLKANIDLEYTCKKIFGRIIVEFNKELTKKEVETIQGLLGKIFGIANFSFGFKVEALFSEIESVILKRAKIDNYKTFRISARRSDKYFPLNSQELNMKMGEIVFNECKKKVNLTNPDLNFFIELVGKSAYIYFNKTKGLGGMPVGVSGKAIVLMSGGFDSPVAAWYALKRGIQVEFLHFHSMPYTSQASLDKVNALVKVLGQYGATNKTYLYPFADIQKQVMVKCPEKLRVVLYRRMMMRIAENLAFKNNCKALVTGEAVAQVASQTLENIRATGSVTNLPIIRPLICFDKEDILIVARQIGTHDISAKPHDDCCTRFVPKHPEIRAKLEEVKKAEESLDVEEIVGGNAEFFL